MFKLLAPIGNPMHVSTCEVSRIVCAIGEAANIVVDERIKRGTTKGGKPDRDTILRKFASAHDLRRAFGQ